MNHVILGNVVTSNPHWHGSDGPLPLGGFFYWGEFLRRMSNPIATRGEEQIRGWELCLKIWNVLNVLTVNINMLHWIICMFTVYFSEL